MLVELHLQRDPTQCTSFLDKLQREGHGRRRLNYNGDIAPTNAASIGANPQEDWILRPQE